MPKRKAPQKLLFLQLPRLDNDKAPGENLPIAAKYLFYALERAGLALKYETRGLSPGEEELDDRHLLQLILHRQPDLICRTLYLWNIERIPLDLAGEPVFDGIPGVTSHRALIFKAPSLYAHRNKLTAIIRRAISAEPNVLWQFVLHPDHEEPLDLLDAMIMEIRKSPALWMDRFASVAGWDRIASRRVFVLLKPSGRYSRSWIAAAEDLLEDHFY